MSEYYFKAPTEEELAATYNGMTFEQFRQLDDDTVWNIRVMGQAQWELDCANAEGFDDPDFWKAFDRTQVLNDFVLWRKHGVPDRDMTNVEFRERVRFDLVIRVLNDPNYGKLTKEDIAHFSSNESELAYLAIDSADGSDDEQPVVSIDRHAFERLGVTYDDLVKKGVLEAYDVPKSPMFKAHTNYVLTGKFAAHFLVNRYLS